MRRLFYLILLLLLLPPIVIAASNSNTTKFANTKEYILNNGLKLIVRRDSRVPVVLCSVWYKVGGSYEHSGITGISHMLEHMMFTGTKKYKRGELDKIINDNGGVQNAITSSDFTMYYEKLAANKLPIAFKLEADRMRNLLLQQAIFDKEQKVVMEERRMRVEDNPQGILWERFMAAAHVNNPYHHPVVGWMTDIENLKLKNLQQWYKMWYAPNNTTVIVVGDVEPKQVYELAKQYFGPLKPEKIEALKPRREVKSIGTRVIKLRMFVKLPWVILGFNTPSLPNMKQQWQGYALDVAANILGGGDSSRFSMDLIRNQGIAVSADAGYDPFELHNNLFVINAIPATKVSVKALTKALLTEVQKLKTQLVSREELDRVKAQIISQNVYQKDSLMYQAFNLGVPEMVGLSWKLSDEYVRNINAVTPKQIQEVVKEYLTRNRLTIAVLFPKKTKQKLS